MTGHPTNDTLVIGAPDPLRDALELALGAQYRVIGLLGRGGMGAVYLARERLLEREVAIKVLPSERADAESRERFLREARTAAQLSHPNIVPLLSFGEMGDTLFYVMRYIDGESLATRLARDGRLPADETARILAEIADALAEAHRLGIVHRDIKPDNVMLDRNTGRAMLTDFGIARRLASTATFTGAGMIVGTPQYMSPEQATGDRTIDGRSDLYSLGILGYRMLTGRLPFAGESLRELIAQQVTAEPAQIGLHAPDAPLPLVNAITRALAKDPTNRWPDADAMRSALRASAGEAIAIPDEIEGDVRGGTRMMKLMYASNAGFVGLYAFTRDPEWLYIAGGSTVLNMLMPLVGLAVRARRVGVPFRRALTMAFWPAAGSHLWWPRALRPPDDVWDRLPTTVRHARLWQTAGFLTIPLVVVPMFLAGCLAGGEHFRARGYLLLAGSVSMLGVIGMLMVAAFSAKRASRGSELTEIERNKLLSEPTHGTRFWDRPAVAKLMSPVGVPRVSGPMTPDGMARAIRELAAALPTTAETIGRDAAAAARELASEIALLDAQMKELVQQADPAEQRRIASRIAGLGEEREGEPEVARQMRKLLLGQAALFADLEARNVRLEARRGARLAQLKMLLLQLTNYRGQLEDQRGDGHALSERIRELCESIERRAEAVAETEQLLQ